MAGASETLGERFLKIDHLGSLIDVLKAQGYTVVGPTIDQGAIVYREIASADALPRGWTDEQEAGVYRLAKRDDDAYFGFSVGPHSWKQFFFPPRTTLATADRTADGWEFRTVEQTPPRYALLGVRACELAAIAVQDRVFMQGAYVDPVYQARREGALIIAVNCTQAAKTCFCTSMGTGPRCSANFDLALTEIESGFLIEIATEAGQAIADMLPTSATVETQQASAAEARQQAVDQITRRLDTTGIRDLLMTNLNHARWDDVATRCLSCSNCTMVCPTCFCASVNEVSDLQGDHVERERVWDSCFQLEFSYMSGGVVRDQIRSRYRQWLTHKLATWIDQFGTSGCVGCGRCITWCPVGIDLTAEVAAIRETS
jgi:sulfhydrogenase subunit beta (sulfur reductase)